MKFTLRNSYGRLDTHVFMNVNGVCVGCNIASNKVELNDIFSQ